MKKLFIDVTDESVWRYFKDMDNREPLTQEKEAELSIRIQKGDKEAMDELILANLKFVISVAKEYQGNGSPLSDLINDGNEGMIKAALRFDHTRGFKFISYAVWWIRQSIIQGLNDNSRSIRLPVNVINKLSRINKKIGEFETKFGRKPHIGEDISDGEIPLIFDGIEYPQISSLDLVINDDGDELSSIIPIEEDVELYEPEDNNIKNELNKILNELSIRERDIIKYYFGLIPEFEPMTLEAIGEKLDLTKERVRQIKEKAIRKLRYNSFDLYAIINE